MTQGKCSECGKEMSSRQTASNYTVVPLECPECGGEVFFPLGDNQ